MVRFTYFAHKKKQLELKPNLYYQSALLRPFKKFQKIILLLMFFFVSFSEWMILLQFYLKSGAQPTRDASYFPFQIVCNNCIGRWFAAPQQIRDDSIHNTIPSTRAATPQRRPRCARKRGPDARRSGSWSFFSAAIKRIPCLLVRNESDEKTFI